MSITTTLDKLEKVIRSFVDPITPFQGTVTALSGGLVKILPEYATTADDQLYARLAGFNLAVNDVVFCARYYGQPVILGKVQNTAPTGYALDAGLTVNGIETLTDFLRYGSAGSVTYTTLTAMGTTAAVNSSSGGSWHGEMAFTPGGTGIASGAQAQINFGSTLANVFYDLVIIPRNAAAGAILWYTVTRGTSAVSFGATTALVSGTLYAISYILVGR